MIGDEPTIPQSFGMPVEMYVALRKRQLKLGCSMSQMLRDAVRCYLRQAEAEKEETVEQTSAVHQL